MPQGFSALDKARCAEREVAIRRAVFPGRVDARKLPPEVAEREIALMEEIAADYRAQARREVEAIQPQLFKKEDSNG